jgi:hypothetical protein
MQEEHVHLVVVEAAVKVAVVVALVEHSSMPEEYVVDSAALLETDSFSGIGSFVYSVRNAVKLLLLRYQWRSGHYSLS